MYNGADATALTKDREGYKDRGEKRSNQRDHGDLSVDGRTGGILEGIADSITDNRSLVGVAALAAFVACFNILLGVVPQTTCVGHKESEKQTAYDVAEQESGNSLGTADDTYCNSSEYAYKTGRDELLERAGGCNVDALAVFGLDTGNTLAQPLDGVELAMYLSYHALCVLVNTEDKHSGEDSRNYSAAFFKGPHKMGNGQYR